MDLKINDRVIQNNNKKPHYRRAGVLRSSTTGMCFVEFDGDPVVSMFAYAPDDLIRETTSSSTPAPKARNRTT